MTTKLVSLWPLNKKVTHTYNDSGTFIILLKRLLCLSVLHGMSSPTKDNCIRLTYALWILPTSPGLLP